MNYIEVLKADNWSDSQINTMNTYVDAILQSVGAKVNEENRGIIWVSLFNQFGNKKHTTWQKIMQTHGDLAVKVAAIFGIDAKIASKVTEALHKVWGSVAKLFGIKTDNKFFPASKSNATNLISIYERVISDESFISELQTLLRNGDSNFIPELETTVLPIEPKSAISKYWLIIPICGVIYLLYKKYWK